MAPFSPKKALVALASLSIFSAEAGKLYPRQQAFVPSPGNFPETGDDTIAGGIFCISLPDLSAYLLKTGNNAAAGGTETPRGAGEATSGSGPYPAHMTTDPSLPNHTIYAPIEKPNITMPFIAWGNGACMTDGSTYKNFLVEIASHGYVISADGPPGGSGAGQSQVSDMRASLDWAFDGGAAAYGDIDLEKVATAGHSCGGLEAMSTAYHDPRVKRIILFNIAIFQDERRYLLEEIDVPVAWFVGGPNDMGHPNVSDYLYGCNKIYALTFSLQAEKDYALLPSTLGAYKASLDTGHGGTYQATNGGKFGKAAVAYLQWQFRDDETSKAICLDPEAEGSLVSDNWDIEFRNWS
ncbi:hypothetical protein jhhlp_000327 [Lomentospora prolificans]|uniref:Chlorophyllase n=1 Tax=Lomentospora prolificans TaxID=41688 RepID=A0A2N3NKI6_9PEZI|nr:hypothetical protein jhhlp_000327 [Lomentospora prolificans]